MEIISRIENNVGILEFHGKLDSDGARDARLAIRKILEKNEELLGLIWDFDHVAMLKTAGLGLAVSILRKLERQNKKFALCQLSSRNRELIHLTKLDDALHIYSTVEEALNGIIEQ